MYRLQFFSSDGQIVGVQRLEAESDLQAVEIACQLRGPHSVEVWRAMTLIELLGPGLAAGSVLKLRSPLRARAHNQGSRAA